MFSFKEKVSNEFIFFIFTEMTGDIMSFAHKDIYYLETKTKTQVSFSVYSVEYLVINVKLIVFCMVLKRFAAFALSELFCLYELANNCKYRKYDKSC